jgi:osmotically inducible protein OsmC
MANADRSAEVVWDGNLLQGSGRFTVESGALPADLPVTWPARTEEPGGKTSPEELIAAAHASCYAMAFSHTLDQAGHPPEELRVRATVSFDPNGPNVTRSRLEVTGRVRGLDAGEFQRLAEQGEQGCPVSNALRGNVGMELSASLAQ